MVPSAAARHRPSATIGACLLIVLPLWGATPAALVGQVGRTANAPRPSIETSVVPVLSPLANAPRSELADVVARFDADQSALGRRYGVDYSPARQKRFEEFTTQWLARLRDVDFDKLSQEGRVDYVLMRHELEYQQYQLKRGAQQLAEMQSYTPFAATIFDLIEARRELKPVNQQDAGRTLAVLAKQIDTVRKGVEKMIAAAKIDTTNARVRDSVRTARFVGFRNNPGW